jgi:hypothetical protein
MIWAWIVLAFLVLYAIVVTRLAWQLRPKPKYPEPHPNVIVHTRDDRSIEGVQMLRDGWGILLGAAKLLNEGAEPDVSLSGDIRIPLANIRMIQEAH